MGSIWQKPGGFVTAVLQNDLVAAVMLKDENINLKDIVYYVCNEIPAPCWGNKTKMADWAAKGGQKGIHEARMRVTSLVLEE